jgi:hypothetical protein
MLIRNFPDSWAIGEAAAAGITESGRPGTLADIVLKPTRIGTVFRCSATQTNGGEGVVGLAPLHRSTCSASGPNGACTSTDSNPW